MKKSNLPFFLFLFLALPRPAAADPGDSGFTVGLSCRPRGSYGNGALVTSTSGGFSGNGTCQRTPGLFTEMTFTTYNAAMRSTTVHALQTPSVLITPPFRNADVQPIFAVASACPVAASLNLNWLFVQWTDTERRELTNTYLLGTATYGSGQITITGQYDVSGSPYWLGPRLMPGSCNTSTGIYSITANVEDDIKGDVYFNAAGMGVFKTSAKRATFFFPRYTISQAADFGSKTFRGITFDSLASDGVTDVRNLLATANGAGTSIVVEPLSDPANGTVDAGATYYKDTLALTSVNSPANGMITGTVTRTLAASGNGTGNIGCIASKMQGEVMLICSGQSPGDNSIPYNITLSLEHVTNVSGSFGTPASSASSDGSGNVYVGGRFRNFGERSAQYFSKLTGGGLDTAFQTTIDTAFDGPITQVSYDSAAGKLYLAGWFQNFQSTPIYGFLRLNTNGSLDTAFIAGGGPDYTVFSFEKDAANSRYWLGGGFYTYNGSARNGVAAVLTTGALDTSFATQGTGFDDWVYRVKWDSVAGKLYAGGIFTNYNGTSRNGLARLSSAGVLDTTFVIGSGFDRDVEAIGVDGSGKVLVGGMFATYNGAAVPSLVRLTSTGALDTSFNSGNSGLSGWVNDIEWDATTSKFYVGGEFGSFNGTNVGCILRLNSDGTLDTTFNTGNPGFDDIVNSIEIDGSGNLTVAGQFSSYNGTPTGRVARIDTTGALLGPVVPSLSGFGGTPVFAILPDPATNTVYIGGSVSTYQGSSFPYLGRLKDDGTRDTAFNVGSGPDYYVRDIAFDTISSKLYVAGLQLTYNGISSVFLTRITNTGAIDTTFDTSAAAPDEVITRVIPLPSGKILVSGRFQNFGATPAGHIARLNTDGSVDTTFNTGTGFNGWVQSIALDSAGRVYVGGQFTQFNGSSRVRAARLNADGSLDTTFTVGAGFDDIVYVVSYDSVRDKVYVGGDFRNYQSTAVSALARLNSDGSFDTTFSIGSGFAGAGFVYDIAVDTVNDKLAIGGQFNSYNGSAASHFIRLTGSGALDTTFAIGEGSDGDVYRVVMDPLTGDYLIGGYLTQCNGVAADRFLRLSYGGIPR